MRSIAEKFYIEGIFDARTEEAKFNLSLIEIVQRSSIIAQRRLTEYSFGENSPNIIIDPPLSHIKVLDFHRGEHIMKLGYETGQKSVKVIAGLISGA